MMKVQIMKIAGGGNSSALPKQTKEFLNQQFDQSFHCRNFNKISNKTSSCISNI